MFGTESYRGLLDDCGGYAYDGLATFCSGVGVLARAKESGCDAKTGEDVGSEKASWEDKAMFLLELAVDDDDEKRFVNQPIVFDGEDDGGAGARYW